MLGNQIRAFSEVAWGEPFQTSASLRYDHSAAGLGALTLNLTLTLTLTRTLTLTLTLTPTLTLTLIGITTLQQAWADLAMHRMTLGACGGWRRGHVVGGVWGT